MNNIVYATTNPGKFREVKNIFAHYSLEITSPSELGIELEVEETGKTLEENAKLKAEAYLALLPDCIIIGDDTGVEIDSLKGEPGIHVRRWKGYRMEDEEIIDYCLERMAKVPVGEREAQFRTVLAVACSNQPIKYFSGILRGEILTTPQRKREVGMPFWPIFYLPKLGMTLGDFHSSSIELQLENPTHRELAVNSALPYLRSLLGQT